MLSFFWKSSGKHLVFKSFKQVSTLLFRYQLCNHDVLCLRMVKFPFAKCLLHDVVCEHQTQDYEVAFEIQNHHLPQRDHRLGMQTPEASVALPEIWEQSMRVPSFPYDTCAQRDHFVFKWFLTMFLSFAPEMSSDRERIFTNIFRIATVSRWNVSQLWWSESEQDIMLWGFWWKAPITKVFLWPSLGWVLGEIPNVHSW